MPAEKNAGLDLAMAKARLGMHGKGTYVKFTVASSTCLPDVLVIEAAFVDRDAAIARDYGHLTAADAAALAAASGVKQLVLTHISGRYADEEILAEAIKAFPNSRIVTDFDHILI